MSTAHFLRIAILITFTYVIQTAPIDEKSRPLLAKPEESPDLFEGDMNFPLTARGVLERGNTVGWPGGIVPYEISPAFGLLQQSTIVTAMRTLESLVAVNNRQCVLFRPRNATDQYYITIQNGQGCWSYVGQNTGVTMNRTVSLQDPGCIYVGTIMHELLHTLGFYHEQSRPDRDSYVRVNYSNIQTGMIENFDKYNNSVVDTQKTPYDYGSVMHYSRTTFSSNGLPTIEPLQANVVIGQRDSLSPIDIQEVQLFYRCNGTGPTLAPTTTAPTITTMYSMNVTSNSGVFVRPDASSGNYYYAAIQVTVPTLGIYSFQSDSILDTYGCLYNNSFSGSSPSANLISSDDDGGGNSQFKLTAGLLPTGKFILVATTFSPITTGIINITAVGPGVVTFGNKSISTTTTTTAITPNTVTSNYSSQLTTGSPKFARPSGGTLPNYFYQAIVVSVTTAGNYSFVSKSAMDTYGAMYTTAFNASQPTANLLLQNDDGGGNRQFQLTVNPTSATQYVLVATSYSVNVTGPFSIIGTGPKQVTYTPRSN